MKVYQYEAKKVDDIKSKILEELKEEEENLIISEKELTSGLFKNKKKQINVILVSELITYIKDYIQKIATLMNIEINTEVKKRDTNLHFIMHSNQNNILIGKNGRTIDALQLLIKQSLYNLTDIYINFTLDVGSYKQNQIEKLKLLAKNVSQTVIRTKTPAKLEYMNSYERRIIHSFLNEDKKVYTESHGEEPNRYIVIKPKEE